MQEGEHKSELAISLRFFIIKNDCWIVTDAGFKSPSIEGSIVEK